MRKKTCGKQHLEATLAGGQRALKMRSWAAQEEKAALLEHLSSARALLEQAEAAAGGPEHGLGDLQAQLQAAR